MRARRTVQGAADGSTWARGQAWGLYGFTAMHRETGLARYLQQAERMARFVMDHPRLPADRIPYWDFDAPGIPAAPRDASAAAIMASALLELATFTADAAFAARARALALEQLSALASPAYFAARGENGGFLLRHSVGALPHGAEIDVPLVYADYYFLEALLRLRPSAACTDAPSPAPSSWAATKPGTLPGAIPANVSENIRPTAAAGLANDVDAVNQ